MPGSFAFAHLLTDQVYYPDVPADDNSARQQFMDLFNAVKDNMNNSLVQLAMLGYVVDTGVANAIAVAVTGATYTAGSVLIIKVAAANTGLTTINLNALGAKNLMKITNAGIVALSAGDIPAGAIIFCVYDGTQYITDVGLASHLADQAPHGATALATQNKLALRDANGNVVSAFPVTNGMNPNLLFNPTWALGSVGWTGIGSNGFTILAASDGTQLRNTTTGPATGVQVSNANNLTPASAGGTYTVSAEMYTSGVTAGQVGIQWFAFDSAKAAISGGTVYAVNGQGWTKYSLSFTTPTNTAYLQIAPIIIAGATFTLVAWRKIKLEYGSVATTYSDDNTLNTLQYGSVLPLAQILSGGNKVQSGVGPNMTVATAGTAVTAVVTFPVEFATTPNIYGFLAGTYSDAGYVNLKVISVSATSFTFQLNSYIAETVGTYWLAIGT